LGSYTTSITFDVSGLGLFNVTDFRVMKREWFKSDWTIWSDITVLDASHVRANNLTSLGDFAIGSIDDPLPVELSSFSATLNAQNYAILNWTTQSESELTGYHVYRSNEPIQSNSVCITTSLIPAQNISTGADYTFTDNELTEEGTYYYWLESMDISGNSTFFGPISLNFNLHDDGEIVSDPDHLGRSIIKNYPNPFKPSTKISFYLQNQEDASITIFNTRGQVVKQYTAKSYNPGWHEINWQGKDDNGSSLPSGIYLVRLTGKSCNMLNKMIMLK